MCNTETQTSPLSHAEFHVKKYQLSLLMTNRVIKQCSTKTTPAFPSKQLYLIKQTSHKSEAILGKLNSWALDTFELRYPMNEWLYISIITYSYLSEANVDGVGWLCQLFKDSMAVGKNASSCDGEISAVCEATIQMLTDGLAPAKVVFLIDSQAAISTLSTPTDCRHTIQCVLKLK
ncbi:reverse transcriptase [Trichonephila clavipes]|nr:reverse transcriptase [Trichonephila clavipes]